MTRGTGSRGHAEVSQGHRGVISECLNPQIDEWVKYKVGVKYKGFHPELDGLGQRRLPTESFGVGGFSRACV